MKKKYLHLTIGAILVVLVPLAVAITQRPDKAMAAWFDDNWLYRAPLTITHNAAVTDNKVKFDIDTATLITNNKMQSDCGDSRFTDINGNLLRYYLDSDNGACNTDSTDYYVLIPTINNGTTVIYHYYGNPSASNGTEAANFSESTLTPSGANSLGSEEKARGPAAYWNLDDATGTTAQDSSPNNLDGTLNNTPAWQTEEMCVWGKCLYFDGTNNENVSKADDAKLDFAAADNFTISAWVKRNGASSANNFILTKAQSGYTGYKLYQDASGDYCFDVSDGTNTDTACTSAVDFDDDKWHLVQGVKSGTTSITLYVDGNQRAQDASIAATGTLANTGTFYIGVDLDGTSNEWLGFIDEVKVYSYARSAAQVLTDYNSRGSVKGSSTVIASEAKQSLSNGLVGYWKMDEASGNASDSSGNGTTITNANSTTFNTGRYGNSGDMELSSSQYYYAADNASLSLTGSVTLSAWIKPESNTADTIYDIVGKWDGDNESYLLSQFGDEIRFYVDSSSNYATTDSANLSTGSWYHVTGAYNSTSQTVAIYINGQLSASTVTGTIPSSIGDDAGRFHLGAEDSTTTAANFYDGKIDEARVYNRAFSSNEAAALYEWAPGPVGYWDFNEGSGTTSADKSGNGNNCTLTNSPTWTTGKYGKALKFGTAGELCSAGDPSSGILDFGTNPFTAEIWFKTSNSSRTQTMLIKLGYPGWEIYNYNSGQIWTKYGDGTNNVDDSLITTVVTDGKWHHLAVVFNPGGNAVGYLDGVQAGTRSISSVTGTISSNQNFRISTATTDYSFDGSLDDVRLYSYARVHKQIIQDMNASAPSGAILAGRGGASSAVAYWDLDEGYATTAYDRSGNGNSLTLSAASWTDSGKFGKAWNGTGARWLSRADDSDFDFIATDRFSISLWFKTDSADNPGAVEYILNKGPTSAAGYSIYANTDGTICFGIDDDTTWGPDVSSCTSDDFYDNSWHHLTAVRDTVSDKIYLYIDAVLKDSDTDTTTATLANSSILYVGDLNGSDNGNEFNADMDEIKIYRFDLTASEVLTEFNRSSPLVLGTLSDNSSYQKQAANQEYCVPGDSTSCTAPVGRWDFEEKSGGSANDSSGNGNTGSLGNGTDAYKPSWISGKTGGALNFDGTDDYIRVASNSVFDITNALTIEGWVKISAAPAASDYYVMIDRRECSGCSPGGGAYKINIDEYRRLEATINNGTTSTSLTSSALATNTWYHVAFVFDSALSSEDMKIYLNGKLNASANRSGTIISSSGSNVNIGLWSDPADGRLFKGAMDQLRVFNYARTSAQVAWDYNRGAPVGHWDFDECQGSTINDLSENKKNGTITIGASGEDTIGDCNTSSTAWGSGATGKYNSSLSLDGTDDYIATSAFAPLAASGKGTKSFSFGGWFYPATSAASKTLLEKALEFQLTTDSNSMPLCGIYYSGAFNNSAAPTTALTLNAWNHILCTYDGSNINTYLNGVLIKQSSNTNSVTSASSILYFGETSNGANFYSGQMDEVKIFNYPLTATQAKLLYNNGAVNFSPTTGSP